MHNHHHQGAAAPGQALPERNVGQKDEDHDAGGEVVFRDQQQWTGNSADAIDSAPFAQITAAVKAKIGVVASAALVGLEVYELADGSYIVSKWGYTKPVRDLAAVALLVRQMGGKV